MDTYQIYNIDIKILNIETWDKYISSNLEQIHFAIWDKYILQFETNIFCNSRQIHFAFLDKYNLQFETNTFYNLRQIHGPGVEPGLGVDVNRLHSKLTAMVGEELVHFVVMVAHSDGFVVSK